MLQYECSRVTLVTTMMFVLPAREDWTPTVA
jgi:hypothetical protein